MIQHIVYWKHMAILKVKKKPIVVEAVQYTGTPENVTFLKSWSNGQVYPAGSTILVHTLEGDVLTSPIGCYIIKGVKGEVWPIQKNIFEETYDVGELDQREVLLNLYLSQLKVARNKNARLDYMISVIMDKLKDPSWDISKAHPEIDELFKKKPERL